MSPGQDGYYHNGRNYIQELLKKRRFSKILACQDLTLQTVFILKSNNQCTDEMVVSMKRECAILHDIGDHEHIIQFLGAVMDVEIAACDIPRREVKMMMELADSEQIEGYTERAIQC